MTKLARRFAIAALACASLLAAPALAEWTEWDQADELGWVEGEADAPLTVIEYFSPTCSHCKEFADEVMSKVESDYIATGKVRWVLREWIRNDADKIIVTQARCLDNDKGLAFLKDVMAHQDDIFVAAQIGTLQGTLIGIGQPYGITDQEKFDTCYKDMNTRFDMVEVEKSSDHYGVHATPTFVVDGKTYDATVAMMTEDGFTAFLDKELAKIPAATN